VLGYGALGKAIVEVILHNHPGAQIVALDLFDLEHTEKRFTFLNRKVTRQNIHDTLNYMGLREGDILIDVSTNIDFLEIWPLCSKHGVMYSNSAQEVWMDDEDAVSYPKDED
jgi:homospermidine synthase